MKILKKIWPITIIFIVWLIFASPFFVKGKIPFPGDYLVNNYAPWNAYTAFLSPVKNGATPDVLDQIYPWKNLVISIWKTGQVPLWNPYSFSGTPLLANYQSAVLSPINLLYFILPFITAWSMQVLLAPLLAGLFTYIFLRSLKVSQGGSVVSSIAFMFCGFITTWMDYGTLTYAILFLPLSLYAIESFFQKPEWYFLGLLTVSVPLSFFSGHFQISIYYLLFTFAYLLFKFLTNKDLKSTVLSFGAVLLGLLISAPQILPSIEFYGESVRSAIFLKTEVIPWGYLPTFLAPDFLGNPVTRNDWFGHYAEWNAYIGLIPLILAFYTMRKINKTVLFFIAACIVSILLSFQTPLLDLLIALKIPVLSTSAASRIIVIFSFSAAVLSGFGFDNLIYDIREGTYKGIAVLVGGFIFLFLIVWASTFAHIFLDPEKSRIAISNLKLPSIIFFVFLLTLLIVSFTRGRRAKELILIVIVFLCAFDSLRFVSKWMPFTSASLAYPQVAISNYLNTISGEDRVFGNLDASASITYKIPSVEGYDPLYIERYGELVGSAKDGLFHTAGRSVVQMSKNGIDTPKLINLLGIKYFVQKKADDRRPWTFPIWEYPLDQFKVTYQDPSYVVFENQKVFPRVFIAGDYRIISDKRKILHEMFSEDTNLEKTVFLEAAPLLKSNKASGIAKIIKYTPNNIQIETSSTASALLVLTDPYYPGWKATLNGKPVKILRADYALRAIEIPAGNSSIEFIYDPDSFRNGLILAGIGFLGLIILLFYSARPHNALS